jgi:hypothetical protein
VSARNIVGSISPAGYPREDVLELGQRRWRVTNSTGRSHTCGSDDGRTGWKRHAVDAGGKAACGLSPGHGWGGDLFESGMAICTRCAVAIGACKSCKGSGRMSRQVTERLSVGERCGACDGKGVST